MIQWWLTLLVTALASVAYSYASGNEVTALLSVGAAILIGSCLTGSIEKEIDRRIQINDRRR